MSRSFILVGDRLDHGGSVVSGSGETDVGGKSVARVGDRVVCSKHGANSIVSGDNTLLIDGSAVARHGDKTACGATLISSQSTTTVDSGNRSGAAAGSNVATVATIAGAALAVKTANFDQAIRFVGQDGTVLAGVSYMLHLANGETHAGVTDQNGLTRRVETDSEQPIVKAELSSDGVGSSCCAKQGDSGDTEMLDLSGVSTTDTEYGTSEHKVEVKGHERALTDGEIAMARQVFGQAIDYVKVKVHNHGYWLFFGFQEKHTAVTPNGQIYMPRAIYEDDYSLPSGSRALFMHEMTHVWQYQLGYSVKWHGLTVTSHGQSVYDYSIKEGDDLSDFNMEQQGNIISDYYMIVLRGNIGDAIGSRAAPEQLRSVLARFLVDPKSKENLPK